MATFTYTALEPSGKRKSGFIDAANQDAAIHTIQSDGRFVLDIKESAHGKSATVKKPTGRRGKVSKSDLALFTRRMADLSSAGLPLDRVLKVVAEQSESEQLVQVAMDALGDVQGGLPVSEALAKHPRYFNEIFCQTLRAGEASGQFPEVASRLAEFQEKEVTRRSQIVGALIYPAILALTAVGVVVFLITFVVPRLSAIFKNLGSDLPITTQMLLGLSGFLTSNYIVVIGAIVAIVVGYRMWVGTETGSLMRDRFFLKAPVVGPVVSKATVSRFARVLGTLVYGGVPILQAIDLAGLASGNRVFRESAKQVQAEVSEGVGIANSMRDTGAFPPVLTHMVAVGEETGDLPKMLGRVSDSLDFEVDTGMRKLTAMVEPLIVLVMGAIVGFVVLSVLLPILSAQDAVK